MVAKIDESLDLTPKKKSGGLFGCCLPKQVAHEPEMNGHAVKEGFQTQGIQQTETGEEEEPETQDRAFDLPELGDEKEEPTKGPSARSSNNPNFVVAFWEFFFTFILLGLTDPSARARRMNKPIAAHTAREEEKKEKKEEEAASDESQSRDTMATEEATSEAATEEAVPEIEAAASAEDRAIEAPATEVPPTEAPATEAPATEAPATEDSPTKATINAADEIPNMSKLD